MELRRLARLLRARWLAIVLGAVLASVAAILVTDWWNRRIEPSYRATAALTYLGTQTGSRGGNSQLQSMLALALDANSEVLVTLQGTSITANDQTSQLLFVATAGSREAANQLAADMRQAFNEADPTREEPLIRARLAEIIAELENLEVQTPSSEPESAISSEDAIITAQIEALRRLLGELAAQLAALPPDPDSDESRLQIDAEMERVAGELAVRENRLSPAATPPDREQELQQGALQVYATELVNEYQTLFLRLMGRNPTTRDDAVTVADLSPRPRSTSMMAGLGSIAGVLLAVAALIMLDQARRPVWSRADIDPMFPIRVELPPRRPPRRAKQPWYPNAPTGARKSGVQALRAGVEGALTGEPVSVGIVDLGVGPTQVATLTEDLGAALAASGRTVLTIDADLERESRASGQGTNVTYLANVLAHRAEDDEELRSFIKRSLGDQPEALPGLRMVPAGRVEGDKVDALARKHFSMLLREARSTFDVVLVTTPPFGHPATDGLAQRLDDVLLVTKAGRARSTVLQQAERDLRARRSALLGAVLLVGRARRSRKGRAEAKPTMQGPGDRTNGSARHLPPGGRTNARRKRPRRRPQESNQGADGDRPAEHGFGHTIGRKVGKTVFALADLLRGPMPGPRLLIYHQVGSGLRREMEVSLSVFRRQLDWLQKHGEVVSLEDALIRVKEPESDRLYVLTFDDGYQDMYENAYPLLLDRKLPFTLYLTTDPVETGTPLTPGGKANPLTWDQVQEMLASGLLTLGSHTHHHLDLRDLSANTIAGELDVANFLIRERLGVWVKHFAYPKGYWSKTAEPLIKERFLTAVLGGGPPVTDGTDAHQIARIPIQRSDGMFFFRRKLKKGMRLEESVRRRVKRYKGMEAFQTRVG